jgi:WD40 repeat protein
MRRPSSLYTLALLTLAVLNSGASAQPKQPRLDAYGDALPDGALLRIGTVRLRPGAPIASMTFSPDGKKLITANRVTGIHTWDVATGKELHALPCTNKDIPRMDPSPFPMIVLSPVGTHVAEVNNRAICSVREVATGTEVCKIDKQHWQNLCLVEFSPNGKILALMSNANRDVDLYDVATGKLLKHIPGEPTGNYRPFMAFTPDSKTLAVPAPTKLAVLFDVATGKRVSDFGTAKNQDTHASGTYSPDGKLLAVLCDYYTRLEVWDVATTKRLANIPGNFGALHHVTFTPDSRWVIACVNKGDTDGEVRMWEATTGKLVHTLTDYQGLGYGLAVSSDGKHLATTDYNIAQIRNLTTRKPLHEFTSHRGRAIIVQFSPDGKSLVSTAYTAVHGEDQNAYVWDAASGKVLKRVDWRGGTWSAGTVSADGRVLAQGRAGEKVTVTEVATKKLLLQVDEPSFAPTHIALTPDGKSLMVMLLSPAPGGGRGKLQLWDVARGKKLLDLSTFYFGFFDAPGRKLVVIEGLGDQGQLTCYDVATGRKLPRSTLSPPKEYRVVLSLTGRLAAAAPMEAGPVALREPASGQTFAKLTSRGHLFMDLAFSPNGRLLAGATVDGPIIVWDVLDGQELAYLKGHRAEATSVSWSPDGKRLVSGSADLTILVWDAEPWLAKAAQPAPKLTAEALEALWQDLATGWAHTAIAQLVRAPKDAVPLLRQKLLVTAPKDLARMRALLADLNSDKFAVRNQAQVELEKLGDLALPLLEKVLANKPTLEVRQRVDKVLAKLEKPPVVAVCLQQMRALAVLEMIGSDEAKALVDLLAGGDPDAWLTREAQAVKQRLLH